jgi:hypothetical protein
MPVNPGITQKEHNVPATSPATGCDPYLNVSFFVNSYIIKIPIFKIPNSNQS